MRRGARFSFVARRLGAGDDDGGAMEPEGAETDDSDLEEVVLFLAVLACLLCCCFSTCIVRRIRRLSGARSSELTQPLLEETDHEGVFRHTDGNEWSCPICGLENRSRTVACDICGVAKAVATSREAELVAFARAAGGFEAARTADLEAGDLPPASLGLDARQRRAARRGRWVRVLDVDEEDAKSGRTMHRDETAGKKGGGSRNDNEEEEASAGGGILRWQLGPGAVVGNGASPSSSSSSSLNPAVVVELLEGAPGLVRVVPAEGARASSSSSSSSSSSHDEDGKLFSSEQRREEACTLLAARYDAAHFAAASEREKTSASALAAARLAEVFEVSKRPFAEKHLWLERELEKVRVAATEGHVRFEVRRGQLLEDSLQQLVALEPRALRQWLRIQFVDEPGIDVGGLEREWFGVATAEMFAPDVGCFRRTAEGDYVPEASASLPEALGGHARSREVFEFAGRLMGKALLEHVPLAAALALPVYKQLLGQPLEFEDLDALDPDLFRNVAWLLGQRDVESLDLDFSVALAGPAVAPDALADYLTERQATQEEEEEDASSSFLDGRDDDRAQGLVVVSQSESVAFVIRELVPGGRDLRVTAANRGEYVAALWRYHTVEASRDAVWHMARGLYAVVPPCLLAVLDAHELELVLCGARTVDVDDWQANTEYAGEFQRRGAKHAVVSWFWRSVRAMRDDERARLLQFCTGSARVPCHGFKALQRNDGKYQLFTIQSLPRSELRFPRAHTCFNRLDLPMYASHGELDAGLKVLIAMDATGFTMD